VGPAYASGRRRSAHRHLLRIVRCNSRWQSLLSAGHRIRMTECRGIPVELGWRLLTCVPWGCIVGSHELVGAGRGDTRVYLGALFEILTLVAGIGMAVTLYPVLRRQSESLALGYVTNATADSGLALARAALRAVRTRDPFPRRTGGVRREWTSGVMRWRGNPVG
jgi:Domain of unknown function (DUF4386)